jgi:hypothetical protein
MVCCVRTPSVPSGLGMRRTVRSPRTSHSRSSRFDLRGLTGAKTHPVKPHAASRDTAPGCIRALLGSAQLPLSGDPITLASVTLQNRLVRFDTDAGTVRYGDPVAFVVGTQATDILGQHDRSAHLHGRGVVER